MTRRSKHPKRCKCAIPTYSKTEWGTVPGSGTIDAYCVNHPKPLYRGQVPLEDWPWKDDVIAMLRDAQSAVDDV